LEQLVSAEKILQGSPAIQAADATAPQYQCLCA